MAPLYLVDLVVLVLFQVHNYTRSAQEGSVVSALGIKGDDS